MIYWRPISTALPQGTPMYFCAIIPNTRHFPVASASPCGQTVCNTYAPQLQARAPHPSRSVCVYAPHRVRHACQAHVPEHAELLTSYRRGTGELQASSRRVPLPSRAKGSRPAVYVVLQE